MNKYAKYIMFMVLNILLSFNFVFMSSASSQLEFKDIDNHWSKSEVSKAVEKGFIKGFDDKTFRPDNYVTYGDVFALLSRVAEKDITEFNSKYLVDSEGKITKDKVEKMLDFLINSRENFFNGLTEEEKNIINSNKDSNDFINEFFKEVEKDKPTFQYLKDLINSTDVTLEDMDKIMLKLNSLNYYNYKYESTSETIISSEIFQKFLDKIRAYSLTARDAALLHVYDVLCTKGVEKNDIRKKYYSLILPNIVPNEQDNHYAYNSFYNLLLNMQTKNYFFESNDNNLGELFSIKNFDENVKREYLFKLLDEFLSNNSDKYMGMNSYFELNRIGIDSASLANYEGNEAISTSKSYNIDSIVASGIIKGTKIGEEIRGNKAYAKIDLKPKERLTRAELAVIINRLDEYLLSPKVVQGGALIRLEATEKYALECLNEKYPGDWEIRDGEMYKGNTLINNNFDVADIILNEKNAFFTIFQYNERISTNIIWQGIRRVGSTLDSSVSNKVLYEGENFTEIIDVMGNKCQGKYSPIKDKAGKIIGIIFIAVATE